jgi:hypothetical protein
MLVLPDAILTMRRGRARKTLRGTLTAMGAVVVNLCGAGAVHAATASPAAWTSPKAIPSAAMAGATDPAIAGFNGLLYAAWEGQSSPYHIWYSAYNGKSWTAQTTVPSALSEGGQTPALAVYNDDLYVGWVGQSSPYHIWYSSSANGASWSPAKTVPSALTTGQDGAGPALTAFSSQLYVAWVGQSASARVWYAAFNGTSWSAQKTIPGASADTEVSGSPALVAFKSNLYASWLENNGGMGVPGPVEWAAFNGTTWSTPTGILLATSSAGVALAVYDGNLYDAWQAYELIDNGWVNTGVDYAIYNGSSWLAVVAIPSSESDGSGPALATYAGSLFAAWPQNTCCFPVGIEYASGP